MFYDFLVAFCGEPPLCSFSNLPEVFLYCLAVLTCVVSLSVVVRGIYSIVAAGFRNKI